MAKLTLIESHGAWIEGFVLVQSTLFLWVDYSFPVRFFCDSIATVRVIISGNRISVVKFVIDRLFSRRHNWFHWFNNWFINWFDNWFINWLNRFDWLWVI